jgi:hypothetical protein
VTTRNTTSHSVITIEDVIEALLQEQIYDENDKREREMLRLTKWAAHKWKMFVKKKKRSRLMKQQEAIDFSMGNVVLKVLEHERQAEATIHESGDDNGDINGDDDGETAIATDITPLVGGPSQRNNSGGGGLGWLFGSGS